MPCILTVKSIWKINMQFKRQAKDSIDVNLTPLIDVVFLLLIFFMVSTTFTDKTELRLDLPEAKGAPQMQQPEAIKLSINQRGEYSINGAALINNQAATLKSAIAKIAGDKTDTPFIITADANTTHQSVVTAMDAAGQLGFVNLSITSIRPNE